MPGRAEGAEAPGVPESRSAPGGGRVPEGGGALAGQERPRGDAFVDWEAERRRIDDPRVFFWGLTALGLVLCVAVWLLLGPVAALSGAVGWAVFLGLTVWLALRNRRRIAKEVGTTSERLPVLVRRVQTGRVPDDPEARKAMAALVRWQLRHQRRLRWLFPVLSVIYLANAVLQWAVAERALAVLFLVAGLATGAGLFLVPRRRAKQERLLVRLETDSGPAR